MQFKLNIALIAAAIAVTSVSAVPTYYNSNNLADLAARSTAEDLAYLEARYSSEVDANNYFAREVVEPEPAATFSRRELDDTINDLSARDNFFKDLFAREADPLSSVQITAFGEMKAVCEKLEDSSKRRKCEKFVKNLATLTGEAHWGFRHYLKITGATTIPAGVEVDLTSIITDHAKGCSGKKGGSTTHDEHHGCASGAPTEHGHGHESSACDTNHGGCTGTLTLISTSASSAAPHPTAT
jgi:hypothetical protein